MKAVLTTAAMSFRMYFRNRASVFFGIIFPLLLMGLIGTVFGRRDGLRLTVSLVGEGPVAQGLAQGFEQLSFVGVRREGEPAALAALRSGDRSLVVVVPPAGSPPFTLQVYYNEHNPQVAQAAVGVVRQLAAEASRRLTGGPQLFRIETMGVAVRQVGFFDFLLPGMMALTLAQSSLMGVTAVVASYREQGVLKRVLATSVRPAAFLAGLVARWTTIYVFQAAIILLVGVFAFGAKTSGQIGGLALLTVYGALAFVGIGFAVSTLARNVETANVLGSLINFPMMFLAGTFWPKEIMPAAIQPVVASLPLTPLVDAMRGVGALGEPLSAFTGGLLYLGAWGLGAFALAAWRFRWE